MLENQPSDRDNEIYLLSKLIAEDKLNYIYCGDFTQSIIVDILSLTEKNILDVNESSKAKKKVYNLMVEALQNIPKHQAKITPDLSTEKGLFLIQHFREKYYITTGNIIFNENIEDIRSRIAIVNSLDCDGLKAYYKQQLISGSISDKGGAGLGLIDMARKSENKLFFDFKDLTEELSYFYFRICIDSQICEISKPDPEEVDYSLGYVLNIHQMIRDHKILLIYHNTFQPESKNNFVTYLEKLLIDSLYFRKELIDLSSYIIERIADISEKSDTLSDGKEVLFYIMQEELTYKICSGCHIKNEFVPEFERALKAVIYLYNKSKEFQYGAAQQDGESSDNLQKLISNISLIEHLTYEFIVEDEVYTYFALNVDLLKEELKTEDVADQDVE